MVAVLLAANLVLMMEKAVERLLLLLKRSPNEMLDDYTHTHTHTHIYI
jgi:hypothetical protein